MKQTRLFGKIKSAARKATDWVKKVTKGPTEFLRSGRTGGMILCAILATQFLFGCTYNIFCTVMPSPVALLVVFVAVILVVELTALLFRLIFRGGKRPRAYFLAAWIMLAVAGIFGSQLQTPGSYFIISYLVALSANVLGRCIFAFIKTRRWKQISGYVAVSLSVAVLIAFALFFRLDGFGEDRVAEYLDIRTYKESSEASGFSRYMENGNCKVAVIDYGQSDSCDIATECVDISAFAERSGIPGMMQDIYFENGLDQAPVAGRIWYPEGRSDCPVLFIVHGNHNYSVPSYLGYAYLGEYLASNGYVVVSVDENIVNAVGNENDARAVLLLENIKAILKENAKRSGRIYGLIDPDRIAIAGHSRGGEMASTAYLFNDMDVYPDDGNIELGYHFNISSIIAIAPTVDIYMPAGHAVAIEDVNYLLIHGSNDTDVSSVMGEKQYNNVNFTDKSQDKHMKASVYVMGANHGQFNSEWGRYDGVPGTNGFLNTNNLLDAAEQQMIAKAYIRVFLDATLSDKADYTNILWSNEEYLRHLPETVYITSYMDSDFMRYCSFDADADIAHGDTQDVVIRCDDMKEWKERMDIYGIGVDGENYVLDCAWEDAARPSIEITFPETDLAAGSLSFRIADMREDAADDIRGLDYTVELYDGSGRMVSAANPTTVYPSLAVQMYKMDVFLNSYEYKHQMQSVYVDADMTSGDEAFDYSAVSRMVIVLGDGENGHIILDDVGVSNGAVLSTIANDTVLSTD